MDNPSHIIVPQPPQSILDRIGTLLRKKSSYVILIGLLIAVVVNALVGDSMTKPMRFETKALAHTANVTIAPNETALVYGETKELQIWVQPDFGTGMYHVEGTFDPADIQVVQAGYDANSKFKHLLRATNVQEMNQSGRFVFAYGLDPQYKTNAPSTPFIAFRMLITTSIESSRTTTISFSQAATKVIGIDTQPMNIITQGAAITLNPFTPTEPPIPTNTPPVVPSATPTGVPPVNTPTPTPIACTPLNGTWEYGTWSACTAACGTGMQFRSVTCVGASCGGTCTGEAVTRQECNTQPCASTITIYAAGSKVSGAYPTMQLLIDDAVVSEWSNVSGSLWYSRFNTYVYQSQTSITPNQVKVRLTNGYNFWWFKRVLRVDKIDIDGQVYQTEDPTTYATGARASYSRCGEGYLKTEWLLCNGYFSYKAK